MGLKGAEWLIKDDGGFVDNRTPGGDIITNDTLSKEAFRNVPGNAANDPVPLTIPTNTIRFESPDGTVESAPADRFYLPNFPGNSVSDESLFQGALLDAKGKSTKSVEPDAYQPINAQPNVPYGKAGELIVIKHYGSSNNRYMGQTNVELHAPVTYGGVVGGANQDPPNSTFYIYVGQNGDPAPSSGAGFIAAGFWGNGDGSPRPRILSAGSGKPVKPTAGGNAFNVGVSSSSGSAASVNQGMPGYPKDEQNGIPVGIGDLRYATGATNQGADIGTIDNGDTGDTLSTEPGSGNISGAELSTGRSYTFSLGATASQKAAAAGGGSGDCPDVDLTPVLEALALLQQLAEKIYSVEGGDAWTS